MPPKTKSRSSPGKRSDAPLEDDTKERSTSSVTKEINYEHNKKISCLRTWPVAQETKIPLPALIFTHGASGTLDSPAVKNFWSGFASKAEILGFNGSMNLSSRVNMFCAVIENTLLRTKGKGRVALGGRSMGARAAVMAAVDEENANRLILVSYPLQSGNNVRDQILLDIDEKYEVLFIIGEKDNMCDIPLLNKVRQKMRATSWLVVVSGATHGMDVTPKRGTEAVGNMTGVIAADWLNERDSSKREGDNHWDNESGQATWSDWSESGSETRTGIHAAKIDRPAKEPSKRKKVPKESEEPKSATNKAGTQATEKHATRSSKRQKRS